MKRLILLLVLVGCTHQQVDPAPVIRPQSGAEGCPDACRVMRSVLRNSSGSTGCPEAEDVVLRDGTTQSCEAFCVWQHNNGVFWDTACIIGKIGTCEQIETVCNTQ